MKNFQENLFILLASALCGLCAFQWHAETVQRNEIETLNRMVFQRNTDIQGYTNSIAVLSHQVEQMDANIAEIKATAATNGELVVSQKAAMARLQFANENLTNTVTQYTAAVDALESKLKEAYAGVAKQNEAITNLIAQRDEFVQKLNDSVKDRNRVVAKYNDLVKEINPANGKQVNDPK